MKRLLLLPLVALALVLTRGADSASAFQRVPMGVFRRQPGPLGPWHGGYYHSAWGVPVALVVPPTAEKQTYWGWGVGSTQVTTIQHQFQRNYPGPSFYDPKMFKPTPPWPNNTNQFGVYYVRGPW